MIRTSVSTEGFEGYLFNAGAGKDKCMILNLIYPGNSIFIKSMAAWLNRQGVAALGLTVVGSKGTQKDETLVPLEYIGCAVKWLKGQGYQKIGILGLSFGAEMALAAACEYHDLSLIISLSGFDQVWEGVYGTGTGPSGQSSFSLNGKGLPFQPFRLSVEEYKKAMADAKNEHGEAYGRQLWDDSRTAGIVEEAVIPVEKIAGRLVLLCAKHDTCWDSEGAAERITKRRRAVGLDTDAVVYEHGVHVLLPDCVPLMGLMIRLMFGEAKKYPTEVKAARRKVTEKIGAILKSW